VTFQLQVDYPYIGPIWTKIKLAQQRNAKKLTNNRHRNEICGRMDVTYAFLASKPQQALYACY